MQSLTPGIPFEGHSDSVTSLCSSTGNSLLSSSRDGSLLLWTVRDHEQDLLTPKLRLTRADSSSSVLDSAVLDSEDASELPMGALSVCEDGSVQHWKFSRDTSVCESKTLGQHPNCTCVDAMCGMSLYATSSPNPKSVVLWNILGRVHEFDCGDDEPSCIVFGNNKCSELVFVGTTSGRVHVVDLLKQRIRKTFDVHETLPITDVEISPDGSLLAAAVSGGEIKLYDFEKSLFLYAYNCPGNPIDFSYNPTRYWSLVCGQRFCYCLDLEIKGVVFETNTQTSNEIQTCHAWSSTGETLFVGNQSGGIYGHGLSPNTNIVPVVPTPTPAPTPTPLVEEWGAEEESSSEDFGLFC